MSSLKNKIDFALIFRVKNANPNGDPLNGNRPRTDYAGLGEVTDVCLKRKIRDRMAERYQSLSEKEREGQGVFVQSNDRKIDGFTSLRDRADEIIGGSTSEQEVAKKAVQTWLDVRAFGQLFAFKSKKAAKKAAKKSSNSETDSDGNAAGDDQSVSIGIRGPVTIQSAFSIEPVSITSTQITKSVNSEGDGSKRGSDTMGMKHRVDSGIYVTYGSINPQLAERTGFSDQDAEVIKGILPRIFENDASSARPEGSMEVIKVIWWKHENKAGKHSSAVVHRSFKPALDGSYALEKLEGVKVEELSGP